MNYDVDSNCSTPFPLANNSSLGNHTTDGSHDSVDPIMRYLFQYVLPGLFSVFQAIPVFFNNTLYNFFPDIAKVKAYHENELDKNNSLTPKSRSNFKMECIDRNTKFKANARLPVEEYGHPHKTYEDSEGTWYVYSFDGASQPSQLKSIAECEGRLEEVVSETPSQSRQSAHTKSNVRNSFWRNCCCMFRSSRYDRTSDKDLPCSPTASPSPRCIG